MIIPLYHYQGGYRIVSLAKCEKTLHKLQNQGLNALLLQNGRLLLYPEEQQLFPDAQGLQQFLECDDYDVFEIDENGRAFRYYDNESDDNAFVITGKCNSNCLMCPSSEFCRRNGSTTSIDHLLQIVNYLPSDAVHLTITGGEPFLLGRDIFRFFEALRNKFHETGFLLLTNGRIFSIPAYCDLLEQTLPPQTLLGIPLHGYDAATHDFITQVPGSFRETVIGLKQLLARRFRIELRIVVSRITAEYLDRLAAEIIWEFPSVETVKFMGLEMLGNAFKNKEHIWLPYAQAFQKSRKAIRKLILAGIDVGIYNFPLCAVDQEFWPICVKSISEYKVRFPEPCRACAVRDACGGIFVGSYRFAKEDVIPIGAGKSC